MNTSVYLSSTVTVPPLHGASAVFDRLLCFASRASAPRTVSGGVGGGGGATGGSPGAGGREPRPSVWHRVVRPVVRWTLRGLGLVLLLAVCATAWLTSPWGERTLTTLVQDATNSALRDKGLHVQLGGIGGLWHGQLRAWDVRLSDARGTWLSVPWLRVVLRPSELLNGHIDIPLLEVEDLAFLRGPDMPPTPEEPEPAPAEPAPIRALPQGWDVRLGDVRVSSLQVGEGDKAMYFFARALGDAGHDAADVRLALQLYRKSGVGFVPPPPVALPEDLTSPRVPSPNAHGRPDAEEGREPLWKNIDAAAQESGSKGLVPQRASATRTEEASGQETLGQAAAENNAPSGGVRTPPVPQRDDPARMGPPRPPALRGGLKLLAEVPALAALVTLSWKDSYIDVRLQGRDTLLLAENMEGIERLWSRTRVQANISQWPPDAAHAVQMRFVSRFGLRGAALGDAMLPSLVAGQALWDGVSLIAQDINLTVPMDKPDLQVQGSLGYNAAHGPGIQMEISLKDLASLTHLIGMKDAGMDGSMSFVANMSRGGEHAAWWAAPLPQPRAFEEHPLMGFAVLLPQKKEGVDVQALPQVAGARASLSPTALHMDMRLRVPTLKLPQGSISGLHLDVQASSADAATAPEGTTSHKNGGANSQAAAGEAGSAHAAQPAGTTDADFTALGLPKALVGKVDLTVASLLDMGDAAFSTRWFAAGWPSVADIFQAQLDDIALKFPGGHMNGAIGLAYALPMRRLWPWLDGNLRVQVDNWATLSRLAAMPISGQGVGVDVGLESLFDPQGRARQYLKAEFKASQFHTPSFSVQALGGQATSQHVHALADAVSLTVNPLRSGSTSPEPSPNDDLSLLDATLRMGAGSGGPLTWSAGNCLVRVAGEDGTFEAHLKGSLNAAVAGSYNFRQRLLKVQDMKLSYLVPAEQPPVTAAGGKPFASARFKPHTVGMQLRNAAQIALGDAAGNLTVQGLDFALLPSGSLRLNARVPMQGSKDALQCALQLQQMPLDLPHGFATLFLGGMSHSPQAQAGSAQAGKTAPRTAERAEGAPAWLADFPVGEISAEVNVGGALDSPTGTVRLAVAGLQSRAAPGVPPLDVDVQGALKKAGSYSIFDVNGTLKGLPTGNGQPLDGIPPGGPVFSAQVPVRTGGSEGAGLVMNAPLKVNASWGGMLAPLLQLYPLPGKKIDGQAALRAAVSGTAEAPKIAATVLLRGGSFEDILNGVVLRDMTVDANYTSSGVSKVLVSLGDGRGGTVRVDGSLNGLDGQYPELQAAGTITRFRPLRRDDLSVALGGNLNVSGPLSAPLVKGNVVLEEGSFELLQGFGTSVRTLEGVTIVDGSSATRALTASATARDSRNAGTAAKNTQKEPSRKAKKRDAKDGSKADGAVTRGVADAEAAADAVPRLDLAFTAPGKFFIRGQGLNSEWRTNLHIRGPVTAPRLVGDVSPVRGTFDFLGKEFRFSGGKMSFDGSNPPNPALDLRLELRSGQVTAFVDVKGTGRTPRLDLTSEPPLPRDEVMAQVLFGKGMGSLSRFETIQAATAAAQLTGMGPAALASLGTLRKGLGLDALRMGRAGGDKGADVGRGMTSGLAGSTPGANEETSTQNSVLEAGKYVTDSIYVGLEQGLRPQDGTGVRVDVELTPNISLSGRTSQQSSGVGLDWKYDY